MKLISSKLKMVMATVAAITLTYMLSIAVGLRLEVVLMLYLLSVAATVWMVIRILKEPADVTETFDDYFYQDRKDIRRYGNE